MTNSIKNIHINRAIFNIQQTCEDIIKDKDVEFNKKKQYSHSSLPNVLKTLRPHLKENGVLFSSDTILFENPILMQDVIYAGNYIGQLIHVESGESKEMNLPIYIRSQSRSVNEHGIERIRENNVSQGLGSALTFNERYCILALLGLAPADDDDAQKAHSTERTSTHSSSNMYMEDALHKRTVGATGITTATRNPLIPSIVSTFDKVKEKAFQSNQKKAEMIHDCIVNNFLGIESSDIKSMNEWLNTI